MTNDTAAPQSQGCSKLRYALMASLALNVLIVGGVAGSLLFGGHHGWKGHGRKGFVLSRFAQTLPADRSDVIRKRLDSEEAVLAPLRKAKYEARDAARGILMTEPFDPEKFKAALERAVEAGVAEKKARMVVFADIAAQLTPEERRQLHNWFEKRSARYRRYREDK